MNDIANNKAHYIAAWQAHIDQFAFLADPRDEAIYSRLQQIRNELRDIVATKAETIYRGAAA